VHTFLEAQAGSARMPRVSARPITRQILKWISSTGKPARNAGVVHQNIHAPNFSSAVSQRPGRSFTRRGRRSNGPFRRGSECRPPSAAAQPPIGRQQQLRRPRGKQFRNRAANPRLEPVINALCSVKHGPKVAQPLLLSAGAVRITPDSAQPE